MSEDRKLGAHLKPEQPVERLSSEGPLDQAFVVHIDQRLNVPVYLDSVLSVKDLMERCPGLGGIDMEKTVNDESIKSALSDEGYIQDDLYLNPDGKGFCASSQSARDQFGVSDEKWLTAPEELIWKSALTAQLQAKHNAITHFLNSAGAVNFGSSLSEEDRQMVARRARQLAIELKDDALSEISAGIETAQEALQQSIAQSKDEFARFVVTRKEAIDEGGFTQADFDGLYPGGR